MGRGKRQTAARPTGLRGVKKYSHLLAKEGVDWQTVTPYELEALKEDVHAVGDAGAARSLAETRQALKALADESGLADDALVGDLLEAGLIALNEEGEQAAISVFVDAVLSSVEPLGPLEPLGPRSRTSSLAERLT